MKLLWFISFVFLQKIAGIFREVYNADMIMEKWEYTIIFSEVKGWINKKLDPEMQNRMNILGNSGWELVSFAPMSGNNTTAWGAATSNFILVFKRRIKTNE